jgi:hypothetical protein
LADNKFRSGRERYQIPEIAQLIAEADPYREKAPPDNRLSRKSASESHDVAAWLAPASQLPADVPEQARAHEYRHDDGAYATDNPLDTSHEDYHAEVPACGGVAWP